MAEISTIVNFPRFVGRAGVRDSACDADRELAELRQRLVERRAEWVLLVAPNAKRSPEGWHLGDISGAAGESLLIYRDPGHRTHIDFNGRQWQGDDLDLIGKLKGLSDFASTKKYAAGLVGFTLNTNTVSSKPVEDERKSWPAVMPLPEGTLEPPRRMKTGERLETRHAYRDRDGMVLFYLDRVRKADGAKRFRPWTWREAPGESKRSGWCPYAPPGALPLYALDRLNGATHILLVEGEKTADAAQAMMLAPGTAVLGFQGTGKVEITNFAPLAGLPVTGWPDHDDQGRNAMHTALYRAREAGAIVAGMVILDDDFPEKWDLADSWPNPEEDPDVRVRELIEAAEPITDPPDDPTDPAMNPSTPDNYSTDAGLLGLEQLPLSSDTDARPPEFSDEALALRFAARHAANLRFVAAWGRWLEWDGAHWHFDDTLRAFDLARAICREASAECNKGGKSIASAKTVAAVVQLARADRRLAATGDQWDSDLWALNTPGGVIDLRTGQLRPHRREDYCIKMTAVAPGGNCPTWMKFLDRIFAEDRNLIAFMQRVAGYALTGSIQEHALFFGHGTGANGKGTFISALAGILGDYATTAPMETFLSSNTDRHPTELAGLRGARLVTAQETEEGRRWAETKIKTLTGGDKIAARFMRQDFFEFLPQFKLLIVGNHKPGLRGVDEAIRRRMNLIPFTITIPEPERDEKLAEKLRAEWPGILAWMIDGCLQWQANGLGKPEAVRKATDEYLASEDAIAEWLIECCSTTDPNEKTGSTELYRSWATFAERVGEFVGSQKRLSQKLEDRGFVKERQTGGRVVFQGIGIIAQPMPKPYWERDA